MDHLQSAKGARLFVEHGIAICANAMGTGQIDIEPRFVTDAAFDHVVEALKECDFIIVYDERLACITHSK
jgi:hypothetical protein